MSRVRTRRLKVYYAHRTKAYRRYPVIRLGGNYLIDMGFNIGDRLDIELHTDMIVIKKRSGN